MSEFAALPNGVSEKDMERAMEEFRGIVGAENVVSAKERIAPYTKIMIPEKDALHMPAGIVMPKTVEEVQAIVGVCNKYRVSVWPISTGRNFGYGSAAPARPGTLVLDLRRMNRIIEVDPDLCYALVEPGVTYQQLTDYIQEHKLPLWLDVPIPAPIAGPVGNTLERGVGYTPYGDHFTFQCGMEVVLANGQVLRTGMGSLENSNTWQIFKWGYGPSLDGLFTQSNFGVVTKMGFWLMPAPPRYKPFVVRYPEEHDIAKAIDTIRPLRIAQIIPNAGTVSNSQWEIAVTTRRSELYSGTGQIPDEIIRTTARNRKLGAWNVYSALYGTDEIVDSNWKIITAAFKASGGEVFAEEDVEPGDKLFDYRKKAMSGSLTMYEFGLYNWRGGGGSLWFSPVSQARGNETIKQMDLAKRITAEYGFDYVALFIIGWRDMHHIVDILYDRTLPGEMEKAYQCYDKLIHEFAALGYGVYRTNTAFMDKVADLYGPVKREIDQTLKRALDPNGIFAPGKSGIDI